ncbi:hypothetical protein [Pseudomonas sp. AM4(2022)]|uniref:hypothetical protein n=1 Tax=Pseudomonas sp. AM4(2022) TaxID=2983408 RepID=UPI002E81C254|nr:hypothetical protein [Pseudomonas sp. AM4(2022)]
MSTTFILLGFSTPADSGPSFSTPVFKRNQTLYLQVISEDEYISDFEEIKNINFDTFENLNNKEYKVGDKAVYAIKDFRKRLIQRSKHEMDEYLRANIRAIVAYPYFYKSACEFSNLKLDLPEFLGCKNNKDFLLWQVLSNTAKEFTLPIATKNRLSLAHKKNIHNSSPPEPSANQSALVRKSKHDDFQENYFERFISFAQNKHQRLAKEKTVLESLVLSEYFSHMLPEAAENLENVRASLVKILEYSKQDSSSSPLQKIKIMQINKKPKYAKNYKLIPRHVIDENTDGLSLIIYVTAAISHFQIKQES